MNVDTEAVRARLIELERESEALGGRSNALDRYIVIVAELAATVRVLTGVIDESHRSD